MATLPFNPKGLLLDLDGTIADSLGVMRDVYQHFLADFGIEGSDAEFASLNGPPLDEVIRRLKVQHGLAPVLSELRAVYHTKVDDVYEHVPVIAGAPELLAQAVEKGCILAVVTSNSRRRSLRWLERVGFAEKLHFVIAAEDVSLGKPDPAPYRLAASKIACEIGQIVAVEDSRQGATSALGAGLATALVGDFAGQTDLPALAVCVPSLKRLRSALWPS